MKKFFTFIIFFGLCSSTFAQKNNFFDEAKMLFDEEKYEESKFLFQRNIVYNPKNAQSYLYLAKIFDLEENKTEQEKYINSTLLLEPKNEEAMYLLIDIELKRSNFSKVEELKKNFKKICLSMCEKLASINSRLKELE
jgi:tetratricopeptide (TPR) repeat protein|tara:strand:- start:139 stop:552 length:414 start_codon:yes stop_codon:yes gene_type:complete